MVYTTLDFAERYLIKTEIRRIEDYRQRPDTDGEGGRAAFDALAGHSIDG
ncbi:hypothetical protein JS533_012470 [Bifidobacterium amazonense]|uniref:Uncharacterized protein n=1 Tax=Bifidobacterium amazonense TaxID=2809027 RepID=A0ABS9VY79_9BIFI|nr:hypothetical protein [Bifidobacterium amazonense]MCH9277066.1 hypothetical protein [Bifidobacterium amazonense]